MARGGKISYKRKTRNNVKLKKKGSEEESDKDYVVSDYEDFDESEDEYSDSLADDESEESIGEFVEEKGSMKKKVLRSRGRKGLQGKNNNGFTNKRKKNGVNDFARAKRRRRSLVSHERNKDNIEVLYGEEDDFGDDEPKKKAQFSSTENYANSSNKKPRKKARVSYREENEDGDFDDSDEEFTPDEFDGSDDDEEFTPDEVDGLDDDEELTVSKKSKTVRSRVQKTRNAKGRKRKRNAKASKRTVRKKPIKKQGTRRKHRSNRGNNFRSENLISRRTRKKLIVDSDSDFVRSESCDYEYTVSEEEREQVKEASEFCRRLTTNLRSPSSFKAIEEREIVPPQRKGQVKKGKEKVLDMKIEVGKQVCGICLSEEGKKTVRGILNCCSHYLCFACIVEWSKVESRCPLCKQRFATITRTARTDGRRDLRDAVITVPERDQIYQPSEEELRGYLEYDNFLCIECQQGGDDAFMLLCDLCDSPAHTYCVGLGTEIPEGNWYCDGCRPTALASSNAQTPNYTPNHEFNNNLSVASSRVAPARETFDLNELYVPETPTSLVNGHSPSPRETIGDPQAFTLYDRRRIHRQIHQILNNRSRQSDRSDDLFYSQIVRDSVIEPQNNFSQVHSQHQASTSMDHCFGEVLHSEFCGIDERIGQSLDHQQLDFCNSRANGGVDSISSPCQNREISLSAIGKEQVQSMVKSHLKSLSRNLDLGYSTFKQIARTSTHTILAACGLEHRSNEVYPIQTRPLICNHLERLNNTQPCPIKGQCQSCFDLFVRNVVKEITCTRVPLVSMD